MYEHKEYSAGFSIKKDMFVPSMFEYFKQVRKCMFHAVFYGLNGDTYRKYRRGKNRCHRCGVKIDE